MRLALCVATMQGPNSSDYPGDIPGWMTHASKLIECRIVRNTPELNMGVVGSYEQMYQVKMIGHPAEGPDVLAFIHDDVICREDGWNDRVLKEFEDPTVGLVGFGGALWHGAPEIYKTPYQLQQLRRGDYRSNVDDAETHGERFTGNCDAAVLDGFALIVRRVLLDRCGGWDWIGRGCDFFCYDYALCALAHRLGYRVRVVGVRCHHRGGGTSVQERSEITSQEAYDKSHRWFYDEFRDVMPWVCR